ncbi:YPDG domain-containing protein [Staphylococcus aureus]|uniref:YPDG domain-containing protein n=1 Tax=Staphylococcus aureus TaxID=1280 RepID=UPI003CC7F327
MPKDRVPEGWTVTVDPDGKVSVTPPADVTPGTKVDIPVKVTYPDGSTEETPVKLQSFQMMRKIIHQDMKMEERNQVKK